MAFTDKFIQRPVLAIVVNLVIVLIGVICYDRLAVRQLPNVDVPVVTVATGYPGANAQVIESQITKPIEDTLSGIEGIDYIQSVSRAESSQVTVRFKLDRDADAAKAPRSVEVKLTTFDGAIATLAFAKLAGTQPNDPGKFFARVTHSDPKHPANTADKLAVFTVPAWLSEQLPASFADFRKAGQPAAPAAPSFLPIPGPAQAAPSPLQPSK